MNEAAWFEKAFPNISFQRNIHGTNEFKNAKGATFLTSKEVSLLPFSKINSNNFNGDYYFRGTKEDTEAFLKELTGNGLGVQATVDSSETVASDTTENQLFLYLTIPAIMVAAIFFCYAIYNGQLTKELAVAGLIGWKITHFAATKAARLVIPPLLIAVPIISGALMYVMQLQTVRGFLSATKSVYLAVGAAPDDKKLNIPTLRDDEWLILYPEKSKPTEDDIEKMKETQRDEWSKKKAPAVKFMPIKDDQSFMTCDSSMRLEEARLQDYTLILVDGGRLKPTGSIKLPSLVKGYFRPHVKNSANAYGELKRIIAQTQADPYVLWISSVYDDVMFQIEEIRTEAAVNAIAFMLLLLIIAFVVKIDVESYLYHHGRRLDVSYLLGYGFMNVHGKRLLKSGITYGIGFGMFIGEIIKLGRSKNNIGERLKEGC